MKRILLPGAGFSRIWGSRLAYFKSKFHERRAKYEHEKPQDRSARRTANATVVMSIFTVVLASVSGGTLWILKRQLTEMHDGGVDTHNLAVAAKLDQRAWVGYGLMTLETPKVGDVAHAAVTYVNTGRTPAKNVAPLTRFRVLQTMVSSETDLLKLSKEGGSPETILGVMYPNMPYPVPIEGRDKFNEADLAAIVDWYTYLWGEVRYRDVFDEPHTMEFCGYRKGLTGSFLQCPFHNQPDYQKNPN
jgi:hypothetical protein